MRKVTVEMEVVVEGTGEWCGGDVEDMRTLSIFAYTTIQR